MHLIPVRPTIPQSVSDETRQPAYLLANNNTQGIHVGTGSIAQMGERRTPGLHVLGSIPGLDIPVHVQMVSPLRGLRMQALGSHLTREGCGPTQLALVGVESSP